ncbi:MAG: chemotaxis protein CheB [Deltaproteobacteria bacterium]|nr:chemotaxis protein CheB [Deltaproteobacteria bacterium]
MRTKEAQRPPCSVRREAVVMGGSAGGFPALTAILSGLSPDFLLPVLVVQHLHPGDEGLFAQHLARAARLPVSEPCDKERIERGHVYTAPANYHMLVERDGTIALSLEARVNWSRPSIDVLFESAALAWGEGVIAIIVSGASDDGARGMRAIKAAGGLTIAQEPATAEYPFMPQAAIDTGAVDEVLPVEAIGRRLVECGGWQVKNCRL